ncbi:DUF167 domain-containing protein [Acidithiobacillus sp. AMEEHan]|uniref:DUF167 domain-containing protein n=1 Tax=Acidithiobacillus sp. AMEEHan TaxID=2994951 RepID=UPI0027E5B782|nr:DUF167 domain-containing protein [Acidithiobacillus sp. AMEEHan]
MTEAEKPFFWWEEDTLVLNILGKPGAAKNAIGKVKGSELKVSVTAEPENGRATERMVQFLAKEFGVKPSAIEVVFGQFSVHKQLRIKAPKHLPPLLQQQTEIEL